MCLEFASCFGGGRTDDYGGERPNRKEDHVGGRRRRDRAGHQGSAYNGTDCRKPAPANHNLPLAAVDEAGHKAYHDGAGGRGGYAAYGQHKSNIDAPKLPAWHNKVGDDACTGTARHREAAADQRKSAAMDYHHYPTTTTTLGRY